MQITDPVTFFAVLTSTAPRRMVLIHRNPDVMHTTHENVAYHIQCLRDRDLTGSRNESIAACITTYAEKYHLHLLDEVGPQPPCRHCQPEQY